MAHGMLECPCGGEALLRVASLDSFVAQLIRMIGMDVATALASSSKLLVHGGWVYRLVQTVRKTTA